MRRDRRQARGRGGRYAHGGNCAMHPTVSGTWRASVYYRLQESPHVNEIEIHSRNSAKQT